MSYGLAETRGFVRHGCAVALCHYILFLRELHLADVDHVVCPVYLHVYLRPVFGTLKRWANAPGVNIGDHAPDAKSHLYLWNMQEAYALESHPDPGIVQCGR